MKLICLALLVSPATAFLAGHKFTKSTALFAKEKSFNDQIADAFFGTFEGNDYPDLGFPTGYSGEPNKHTLDAWNYGLDSREKKALQRQVSASTKANTRPRSASAYPAAVPVMELLDDMVDAPKSASEAYLATQVRNAFAGAGGNDYPDLGVASGYTGTKNKAKGMRADFD
jgi:hypothetical protein